MHLPVPRGDLSQALNNALLCNPSEEYAAYLATVARDRLAAASDVLDDGDLQLSLFVLYELHYRGFEEVDDRWEWNPGLISLRARIEEGFEQALREAAGPIPSVEPSSAKVAQALFELAADDAGPSVSKFIQRKATAGQAGEFLILKSIYQLKEADPHTWAIPKLEGRAKAAMVEIQADEYGNGQLPRMHSELFRQTMKGLGLRDDFGAYVDRIPAVTLAAVNMISLFGMHRRLRGAITGHLALYEMTSSIPQAAYARGFRRLGYESPVTDYFDEHVEADAVHEQIAGRDLAGGLAEDEPDLVPDILFGAQAAAAVDALAGAKYLDAWEAGRSALHAGAGAVV
ncbi:iron-containing redox enzyme family protein [Glutamicibacter sp. NPDC087831]|uniref:iron-containing redox enzyme family protein n=1 Tax=Micrococcaceae TaxID=1268 RepID=UPI0015E3EE8E|nr:iron-containing redox enzyme family protein [Arthrobacter sp. MYb214]